MMRSTARVVLQWVAVTAMLLLLPDSSHGQSDFDFFYLVQQWPGAYCDAKSSTCCYPTSGKPATDFGIHGLWPNYNDGSYPSNCDPSNSFDESQTEDLENRMKTEWPTLSCPSNDGIEFWTHEWNKHGTCSESVLNQHQYFKAALDFKDTTNLLQALRDAGIEPNDEFYSLNDIKQAIEEGTGFEPWIKCNQDVDNNSQLYEVFMCVETSGKSLINCPIFPSGNCGSQVQFPAF